MKFDVTLVGKPSSLPPDTTLVTISSHRARHRAQQITGMVEFLVFGRYQHYFAVPDKFLDQVVEITGVRLVRRIPADLCRIWED